MLEIINWLIKMEKLAGDFYDEAAEYFKNDPRLYHFLLDAAEDEAMHFHVMGSARTQLENVSLAKPLISLDDDLAHKLETPLMSARSGMQSKTLSVEQLLDCIIETEFSEWNKIFLYVVNSLKKEIKQFYYSAAKIQNHMGRIQHFLESIPYGAKKVGELQLLDRVFDENILVVEDEEILSEFIESLLEEEGNVDVCYNGMEALKQLDQKYYKLIVTDINMPVMNGLEFYKEAVRRYPNMKNRFLFMTGYASDDIIRFTEENKITLLPKPSPLEDIIRNALRIMHDVNSDIG